jgi:hypothetical protein
MAMGVFSNTDLDRIADVVCVYYVYNTYSEK